MTVPAVCVVICCYNAATTVSQTLDSLQAQKFSDFEIIAIDDGSNDNTVEVLRTYAKRDRHLRILVNPSNRGTAFTRQRGLEATSAERVIFFDADDYADPHLISILYQKLVSDEAIMGVSCYAEYFSDEKTLGTQKVGATTKDEFFRAFRDDKLYFQSVVTLFNRDLALRVGGVRINIMPNALGVRYEDYAEDLDLWCRMSDLGAEGRYFLTIPQPLFRYRKPLNSLSTKNLGYMQLKMRWIKDCLRRRRSGQPERSLAGFISSRSIGERLADLRSDKAAYFYKRAAFSYAQRNFLKLLIFVAAAGILSPKLIRQKIATQRIKR